MFSYLMQTWNKKSIAVGSGPNFCIRSQYKISRASAMLSQIVLLIMVFNAEMVLPELIDIPLNIFSEINKNGKSLFSSANCMHVKEARSKKRVLRFVISSTRAVLEMLPA